MHVTLFCSATLWNWSLADASKWCCLAVVAPHAWHCRHCMHTHGQTETCVGCLVTLAVLSHARSTTLISWPLNWCACIFATYKHCGTIEFRGWPACLCLPVSDTFQFSTKQELNTLQGTGHKYTTQRVLQSSAKIPSVDRISSRQLPVDFQRENASIQNSYSLQSLFKGSGLLGQCIIPTCSTIICIQHALHLQSLGNSA